LLAAGLAAEKSSRATNMVYSQMLFALIFDKIVFGITPTMLSILGSSLILGSTIYVAMLKESRKNVEQTRDMEMADVLSDEEIGLIDNESESEPDYIKEGEESVSKC